MSGKISLGQAPNALIPKYIGTEFDHVVNVSMNMDSVKKVATMDPEDLAAVADNIEDVVTVGDNIEYVIDVAEGLHGMPVVTFTGPNPPTVQPIPEGSNWFCTENGRTYLYYIDEDSRQWVESTPQSGFPTETPGIFDGIRDGVTLTAPTENAVYDALTLKADKTTTNTIAIDTREALRRSYAEAGYTLVAVSFERGGTVNSVTDALLYVAEGKAYSWEGTLPKTVPAGSTPSNSGGIGAGAWQPQDAASLRQQLAAITGPEHIGLKRTEIANSVATTLQNWIRWTGVNVISDCGAKGDGITDDTTAIRNAIATGKSVYFPAPAVFYSITDEIGPKFPGQILFSDCRVRGFIRNVTNSNRLAVFGDPSRTDGAAPQSGMRGMHFFGNVNTIGGIALPTALTLGNAGWTDASKDCILTDCGADFVGNGWALEVYSWENEITNFTGYEGNKRGAIYADSANQNNTTGLYVTGCAEQSLQIGGDVTARRNRANVFNGLTAQQSGGAEGVIVIADADNTVINGIYSESNNTKGAPRVVLVKDSARGTQINGVSHLSGGAIVIRNEGLATAVNTVISSNVTGVIVDNQGSGSIVAINIEWMPGVTPSGAKFADNSTNKTGLYIDGSGTGDQTISSFAPILRFNDLSASVPKSRFRYDQSVFRLEYDSANNNTYSTLLWAVNATVPEMIVDGILRPNTDNDKTLGSSSRRWSTVYAGTGTINTSDAREKTSPLQINDAVLDAWGDVQLVTFQWLESIRLKGEEARWHFGVIAQQVRDAFIAHGLDGCDYGLLCYDEWQDEFEDILGEDGEPSGEMKQTQVAGNRWGIRPDQCAFLEAAYQRRQFSRLELRLAAVEESLALLTGYKL